jgi:hypothetical protein
MALRSPNRIWKDCCKASIEIRAGFGLKASIDYLVGEKFMVFAQTAESTPEFLAELPAFSKKIRTLFTTSELEEHFQRAEDLSRVDPDILTGVTAEEAADLRESFEQDRRDRERRNWVKAMLLRSGS